MKTRKLHISNKSYVKVHMGHKVMEVVLRLPIRVIAQHAVKAAFGKLAKVANGKR